MEIQKKYWDIQEVARKLNVNTSTLRFWQDQFNWIDPKRGKGHNERKYEITHIQDLTKIKILITIGGSTGEGIRTAKEFNFIDDLVRFHFDKQKNNLSKIQIEYFESINIK